MILAPWQRAAVMGVSPWTPAALGITPLLELRKGVGITTSGGLVTAWEDQSGHGTHATQTNAAKQPALDATGILFDGSDDGLDVANTHIKSLNRHTIILCMHAVGAGGAYARIFSAGNVNTGAGVYVSSDYGKPLEDLKARLTGCSNNGPNHRGTLTTGAAQVLIARYDGANSGFSVNGGAWDNVASTGNVAGATGAVGYIGGDTATGAATLNGYMHDVWIYDSALSDSDCAKFAAWLKALRGTP